MLRAIAPSAALACAGTTARGRATAASTAVSHCCASVSPSPPTPTASAERRGFEALKAWAQARGAVVSDAVAFDDADRPAGPRLNAQPGGGEVSGA